MGIDQIDISQILSDAEKVANPLIQQFTWVIYLFIGIAVFIGIWTLKDNIISWTYHKIKDAISPKENNIYTETFTRHDTKGDHLYLTKERKYK
jgi:hypothetical protein